MNTLFEKVQAFGHQWRTDGRLVVCYALLLETLVIGYIGFIGLYTLEMLLPTFITVRLSLTKFFFLLIILTMITASLGRFLNMQFSFNIHKKHPLVWIGCLWLFGISMLALYKFPPFIIPLIILSFFLIGYLFWKILFGKDR